MSLVRFLLIAVVVIASCVTTQAQQILAYVTFINNSSDVGLKTVDVYLTQASVTTKFEDIAYQQSVDLNPTFGDLQTQIQVAPGNSADASSAFATYSFLPKIDSGYIAMVRGVRTPADYAPNPNGISTAIAVDAFLTVFTIPDHSKTGFYTVHGVTDLGTFDVYFRGTATPIASNLSYGQRTPSPVAAVRSVVTVDVTKAGDKTKVLGSFALNIPGLSSEVVVLIVSGFKTPGDNSGSTDSLALLAVLESGQVVRASLIAGSQTARVQIVNNLPEILFNNVDVWVKADVISTPEKKVDNLGYHKATGFVEFPSGTPLQIGITLSTSTLFKDTIFTTTVETLKPGRAYTFVLTGVSTTGFKQNPEKIDTAASVVVLPDALEAPSLLGQLAVRAGNFTTDSPPLTIFGSAQFIAGASYKEAAPEYVHVEPRRDTIWVRDDSTGARIKGYVCTPCEQSRALLALTSGFRFPDSNKNGPAFKLIFVQSDGTVISNAAEVDTLTSSVDEVIAMGTASVRSYPNPVFGDVTLAWVGAADGARVHLYDIQGNLLLSTTVASGSQSTSIPTSALSAGVHLARVVSAQGSTIGSTTFSVLK
ncbi:MAG: T9SS type A sorting domain-containing protein [bacterium]|nr:T9SS type A sorting domain-containing protein [bacterium]